MHHAFFEQLRNRLTFRTQCFACFVPHVAHLLHLRVIHLLVNLSFGLWLWVVLLLLRSVHSRPHGHSDHCVWLPGHNVAQESLLQDGRNGLALLTEFFSRFLSEHSSPNDLGSFHFLVEVRTLCVFVLLFWSMFLGAVFFVHMLCLMFFHLLVHALVVHLRPVWISGFAIILSDLVLHFLVVLFGGLVVSSVRTQRSLPLELSDSIRQCVVTLSPLLRGKAGMMTRLDL